MLDRIVYVCVPSLLGGAEGLFLGIDPNRMIQPKHYAHWRGERGQRGLSIPETSVYSDISVLGDRSFGALGQKKFL